jgi:hypothetical protein
MQHEIVVLGRYLVVHALVSAGRIDNHTPKAARVKLIQRRFGDGLRQELNIVPKCSQEPKQDILPSPKMLTSSEMEPLRRVRAGPL